MVNAWQLLPLALSVNTVAVMWLAGSKRPSAWVLGLAGQVGWLALCVVFGTWGLLPLVAALSFVYGRNLWRWTRALRCSTCGQTLDSPPCQFSPETGRSGHTVYGGVKAR